MSIESPIPELKESLTTKILLFCYQGILLFCGMGYCAGRFLIGKRVPGMGQRLAWYSSETKRKLASLNEPIWLHAVSVGEVLAAQSLIEQFQRRFPNQSWVMTTVTPTGQAVAQKFLRKDKGVVLYLPWDFTPIIRRAIRTIRPSLFLVLETELWPVLFHEMGRKNIPIFVVNGRISPSAYKRYLLARPVFHRILIPVTAFLTQSLQDARRYAGIGAAKDRIVVTGNIKWDVQDNEEKNSLSGKESLRNLLGLKEKSLLWTAGSTHPGEEESILQVYQKLKIRGAPLRLLIAPRHPERVREVERKVQSIGLSSIRRTALGNGKSAFSDESVFLLDTLGELSTFYAASDLVFVGGSLTPNGGHNLVEPAAFSRPILTGSHLQNFQAIAESLSSVGGMVIVRSAEELEEGVEKLLREPALRKQLGARARKVIQDHRGATERTVQFILRRWNPEGWHGAGASGGEGQRPVQDKLSTNSHGTGFHNISILLVLAEWFYRLIIRSIHYAYMKGLLKVHRLPAMTVSVGNLTWGGTGKTPLVMHLAAYFRQKGRRVAVLTRGYGKDEALLLNQKLHPIPIIVDPDRVAAGQRAVTEFQADLLLLDDGYQQWRVKKDLEILTVDATAPFGNGHLIPRGTLREPMERAARADIIVVTKMDQPAETGRLETTLRRFNPNALIFFSRTQPSHLIRWPTDEVLSFDLLKNERVCTLAGIASPQQFESTVRRLGARIVLKYRVRDHHPYTTGELIRLFTRCQRNGIRRIVTTAKDAVRIPKMLLDATGSDFKGLELWVLEIQLEFLPNESFFLHRIDSLLAR